MSNTKQLKERIVKLEDAVNTLRADLVQRITDKHLLHMGQRITHRLFELGGDKLDLELIASLNTLLDIDLLPVPGKTKTKGTKRKKAQ